MVHRLPGRRDSGRRPARFSEIDGDHFVRVDRGNHDADYAYSLAVSPNGSRVFVTGYANMGATGNDYVTIAYATGTGATVWGKSYIGPGNSSDYGYSVAVSPDSSKVFVTGESYGGSATDYDYATAAYAI